MAGKQESALTQQSDCKWVRALDANGNSIRISKVDLAAVVGELIGPATQTKNGLLTSGLRNCINYPLRNSGSEADKIYELTGFYAETNLIFAVGRDNGNNLSNLFMTFNNRYFTVISKNGNTLKAYYKKEGNLNRYFFQPISSYGSIICNIITDEYYASIKFEDVSTSVSLSELTEIL